MEVGIRGGLMPAPGDAVACGRAAMIVAIATTE